MPRRATLGLLVWLALWGRPAAAQEIIEDTLATGPDPYASGVGMQVVLANSGFGLGAYYRAELRGAASFIVEGSIGAGKDEREIKFFTYFRSYIPNKGHYFIMAPLQAGFQQRLFRNTIEDNFRPYVQLAAGPALGWVSPYFRDCNGNGRYDEDGFCANGKEERVYGVFTAIPKGEGRLGWNGLLAVGAHFGSSTSVAQGVRIGYAFSYFSREVPLLEPQIPEGSRRYFGSPTITLTFGRIL